MGNDTYNGHGATTLRDGVRRSLLGRIPSPGVTAHWRGARSPSGSAAYEIHRNDLSPDRPSAVSMASARRKHPEDHMLNGEPIFSVVTFLSVSEDTMRRAQLWDCARCRAIVIDKEAHARWHVDGVAQRVT